MAEAKRTDVFWSKNGGPGNINLNINEDEAQFLVTVLGAVAGDATLSPRRHEAPIRKVLMDIGVESLVPLSGITGGIYTGHLYFENDTVPFEPGYFKYKFAPEVSPRLVWYNEDPGADYVRAIVEFEGN